MENIIHPRHLHLLMFWSTFLGISSQINSLSGSALRKLKQTRSETSSSLSPWEGVFTHLRVWQSICSHGNADEMLGVGTERGQVFHLVSGTQHPSSQASRVKSLQHFSVDKQGKRFRGNHQSVPKQNSTICFGLNQSHKGPEGTSLHKTIVMSELMLRRPFIVLDGWWHNSLKMTFLQIHHIFLFHCDNPLFFLTNAANLKGNNLFRCMWKDPSGNWSRSMHRFVTPSAWN